MNGGTSLALVVKDCRVLRAPIAATAIFGLVPYTVALAAQSPARADLLSGSVASSRNVAHAVGDAAMVAVGVTTLLAAAFGGMAFAAERRDRSAEFVALLPVGRGPIMASKAVVSVTCLTVAFAFHFYLWSWSDRVIGLGSHGLFDADMMIEVAATTGLLFGLAWLWSAMLNSPAISAIVAAGVVAATTIGLAEADVFRSPYYGPIVWEAVGLAGGAAAFVGGSLYYHRRVTP